MKKLLYKFLATRKFQFFILLYLMIFDLVYSQKPELVVQLGHTSGITSIAFSPDNKMLASGGEDNIIKLWSVNSGKELMTFTDHLGPVTSLTFHPFRNILASASDDKTIKIHDVDSGNTVQTLLGHSGGIKSIIFSPDGKTLASGSVDGILILWNLQNGKILRTFKGHTDRITSISFSPDSKLLLSGSFDRTIRIWDIFEGKEIQKFIGHTNIIRSISFNPDNQIIASGSDDSTIRIWNIKTGKELKILRRQSGIVSSIFFNRDGKNLVGGSVDNTIKIWDVKKGKLVRTLSGYITCKNSIFFNPNWTILASLSDDNKSIKLCNISNGKEKNNLTGHSSSINAVAFNPNNEILACGSGDNIIRLWNLNSGKEIRKLIGHSGVIRTIAYNPEGKMLASGGDDNTIKLWDISDASGKVKELKTLNGHSSIVFCIAFSPDGRLLASGSSDKSVKIWDISSGKEIGSLSGFPWSVKSLCFSPNGKILVTGSNTIKLWEVNSGKEIQILNGHKALINSVIFSPDGKTLASGSLDKTIKLWEIRSNGEVKEIETLTGHRDWVRTLCFSPDGKILASGGGDKKIILWDVKGRNDIRELIGFSSDITSISFTRDGKYLACGVGDGKTKLWEVETGKELASLISLDQKDWAVVTPGGRFDGSNEGMKLLHYVQKNHAIPLDAFFEEFYTPYLIKKIIEKVPMPIAVRGTPPVDFSKEINLPAFIKILSPGSDEKFESDKIQIKAELTDMGRGIDEIRLFQNDKLINEENLKLKSDFKNKLEKKFEVNLVPGINDFRLSVINFDRTESNESIRLDYKKILPTINLFLFAVGINKYQNENYNLNYGKPDAESFSKTIEERANSIFKKIYTFTIFDEKATRKEIESVFLKIISMAKPTDVFIFYYAGHGVMTEGTPKNPSEFFLVLSDITQMYGKEESLLKKGISAKNLKELCTRIKSQKQLIILDACQSGGALQTFSTRGAAEEKAVLQLARSTGIILFASTASEQYAAEVNSLGHGIFTYALIKGIEGEADGGKSPDKKVTVKELESYINDVVPELSLKYKGTRQFPNSFTIGQDFPISIVK